MDTKILETQSWLNLTYGDNKYWKKLELTGKTGWPTIRGLITALQIELGISAPNGSFGPATEGAYKPLTLNSNNGNQSIKNQIQILKGAMWCKGFSPGYGLEWEYDSSTALGIREFQKAAGLTGNDITGQADKITMRALMNMDAFQLVPGGDTKIRTIQQGLNSKNFKISGLYPCDGLYGRETNKSLLYGLQIAAGVAGANGNFGPGTLDACAKNPLEPSTSKIGLVKIAQYALYCNGSRFDPGNFSGRFDSAMQNAIKAFQAFTRLPVTGSVGFETWTSLLRSCGDKDRKCTVCDTATKITDAKAKTLKANGYQMVGRYIAGGEWKRLTKEEAKIIFNNGLKVFPIFQKSGTSTASFNERQGEIDGREAIKTALELGFPEGTIIYFGVDFDAQGAEIVNSILPHFESIKSVFNRSNPRNYKIGVYGTRNICIQVSNKGYAETSYVSDMSTGYSGNLGFPLPTNWGLDQIKEFTIGSGEGAIAIDNLVYTGYDKGTSKLEAEKIEDVVTSICKIFNFNVSGFGLDLNKEFSVRVPFPGTAQLRAYPKATFGDAKFNLEIPISKNSMNVGTLIDDVLYQLAWFEPIKGINFVKNDVGSVLGDGKILFCETYDPVLKWGFKIQLEMDATRIDGYASETVCVSIAYFPDKLQKELEEFFEKIKEFGENPAKILFAVLVLILLGEVVAGTGVVVGGIGAAIEAVLSVGPFVVNALS